MQEQIQLCIQNLLSIKATLCSLKVTESYALHDESISQLRIAHTQLVETLFQLAQWSSSIKLQNSEDLDVGSIILAPRYYRGVICQDLAIVIQLVFDESVTNEESKSDEKLSASSCKIIWLRPVSVYEMNSSGIMFPKDQLKMNGIEYFELQYQYLQNIRVSDAVLTKSAKDQLWSECNVQRINDKENSIDVLTKSGEIETLEFNIKNIAPLPKSYLLNTRAKTKRDEKHKSLEDDEDYMTQQHYIDKSSIMLHHEATIKVNFDEISGFANWEVHTKRFGSRMLGK